MKIKLLLITMLAFITALLASRFSIGKQQRRFYSIETYKKNLIRCTPDWEVMAAWIEETDIPPIAGAGNYKWKITTANDSAQFYFNQGINMYYSFHIIECMASFKKAARFDPSSAMLQWAQALAYGPNINDLGYAASPEALLAVKKAKTLSADCSSKEKLLIDAQLLRYSEDPASNRTALNELYAAKMKAIYKLYPHDADVAALYADALMLQHPWDLWKNNGTPKPWTPQIRSVLEKLLAETPLHPGANHYYIHVMEASPFAYKALPSADRLGKLTPGLSHTVHMPSHIYLRTGNYNKGVAVNEAAISDYEKLIPVYAPVTGGDFLYSIHNLHMQTNNAMLAGRLNYSVRSAAVTVNSVPKDYLNIPGALGNYVQYVVATPLFVDIRFERWNEILQTPAPPASQVYASLLWHFAKGMAEAGLKNMSAAAEEQKQVRLLMKDSSLLPPMAPFSAAVEGAIVADELLAGTIALQQKDPSTAILHFQKAVTTEQNMVYNEPRDWMLNPKPYLGNAYLAAGNAKLAAKIFSEDLAYNNENGWALYGLYQSLKAQHRDEESGKVWARYQKAFAASEIKKSSK